MFRQTSYQYYRPWTFVQIYAALSNTQMKGYGENNQISNNDSILPTSPLKVTENKTLTNEGIRHTMKWTRTVEKF